MHHILVGTDFSTDSGYALRAALRMALRGPTRIVAVHVGEHYFEEGWPIYGDLDIDEVDVEVREALEEKLESWVRGFRTQGVQIETAVVFGAVADQLEHCAKAWGCDLIIVASGAEAGARCFQGSLARQLAARTQSNLMIVKPDVERRRTHRSMPCPQPRRPILKPVNQTIAEDDTLPGVRLVGRFST